MSEVLFAASLTGMALLLVLVGAAPAHAGGWAGGYTNPLVGGTYNDYGFGTCTTAYDGDLRVMHRGTDGVPSDPSARTVRALTSGTIINWGNWEGTSDGNWGWWIAVLHRSKTGGDFVALYAHLNNAGRPAVGSTVREGQKLGTLNNTSNRLVDNMHLHLGVIPLQAGADLGQWKTNDNLYRGQVACGGSVRPYVNPIPWLTNHSRGTYTCDGKSATIVGSSRTEVLRGTSGSDVIVALGGNDKIYGLGGNDRICAGNGTDRVWGGSGADRLHGNAGNDTMSGEGGNDVLKGWDGNDILYGGTGNDTLQGNRGNDYLNGKAGWDSLTGGPGADSCFSRETSASGDWCERGLIHNSIMEITGTGSYPNNPSFLVWNTVLYHIGSGDDYWQCYSQTGGNVTVRSISYAKSRGWRINWASNVDRCW